MWLCEDLLNPILDRLKNTLDYIRLPKRKRLSDCATLPKERLSDWASLPEDLLNLIINRFEPCDYNRLIAVCKSWNLMASRLHKDNRIRLSNQPPWLLKRSCHGKQYLFNYAKGAPISCKLIIPDPYRRMLLCGCCHGRLIFFESPQLVVLDPLSGVVIKLPPFNNRFFKYVDKVISSTDPCLGSKFEVLATCRYSDVVAHLVFGETMWTYSERTRDYYTYNFVFYKNRILGASKEGRILSLNVINSSSKDSSSPTRISLEEISSEILSEVLQGTPNLDTFFVANTNGELLMVARCTRGKYFIFKIIINSNGQIDLSLVVDLGGHCLFLGKHNSTSVMASNYPGYFRPNTIYYVRSQGLQNCGGFEEFNLDYQTLRADDRCFAMCEGSWFVPSLKLVTS
ncbi:hypothetical protein FNV43_RR16268 [Rhamnella rubrinervis]|uniref:F-box domain-containing protein n=1 Tax=Rhamnella rubrinervis TaxID=2594499 RepID=A0A8K0E306_9ROSA|nr:hypothetical protein FNV43_RR16268 [Rhamnella rubrinervis]